MDTQKDESTKQVEQDGQEEVTVASGLGITKERTEHLDEVIKDVFDSDKREHDTITDFYLSLIDDGYTKVELMYISHQVACINTENFLRNNNPLAAILGGVGLGH